MSPKAAVNDKVIRHDGAQELWIPAWFWHSWWCPLLSCQKVEHKSVYVRVYMCVGLYVAFPRERLPALAYDVAFFWLLCHQKVSAEASYRLHASLEA